MRIPGLKSRRAKITAGVVALAVLGGGAFGLARAIESARPEVQLTTVARSRITNSVVAVADIEAGARNTITLSPSVRVIDVLVEEGQRVAAGDLLAVLDTSEFDAQLEQQGITLEDARSTLRYLSGPSASANSVTAAQAVDQARVALQNALAAEEAARVNLGNVPGSNDSALRQAELALESAQRNADAAASRIDSVREVSDHAVRQAELTLDAAELAEDKAARDLADLKNRLASGQITQAEYNAQFPSLQYAVDSAANARRSAQVSLENAQVTADANVAAAEQAAEDADTAVAHAEAARDSTGLQADAQLQAAERAVADAQRGVQAAEITLAGAQSGTGAAAAANSERVSNQRSQISLLDANIAYLADKIDQGSLRASVDGVVSRMDAVAGEYPQTGDAIVVQGASGYLANLDVSQADSVGVKAGQRASVTLKGIGTVFTGSVARVAPIAEKSATSADQDPKVTVEVSVLDPDDTIRIGFEADVEIFLDDKQAALQVAADAVRSEPGSGRRYVFVVDDARRLHQVFIRTGIQTADSVEVLDGLTPGQECVLDPADSLTDGVTVRIAGGAR